MSCLASGSKRFMCCGGEFFTFNVGMMSDPWHSIHEMRCCVRGKNAAGTNAQQGAARRLLRHEVPHSGRATGATNVTSAAPRCLARGDDVPGPGAQDCREASPAGGPLGIRRCNAAKGVSTHVGV